MNFFICQYTDKKGEVHTGVFSALDPDGLKDFIKKSRKVLKTGTMPFVIQGNEDWLAELVVEVKILKDKENDRVN